MDNIRKLVDHIKALSTRPSVSEEAVAKLERAIELYRLDKPHTYPDLLAASRELRAALSANSGGVGVREPPFEFDRYIDGALMAEGVRIERQPTLERAAREAARIASRGPNGETPVLVLRIRSALTGAKP